MGRTGANWPRTRGLKMPSKSEKQRKFFGVVRGIQKGTVKNASKSAKKAARTMTAKQVKDFVKKRKR